MDEASETVADPGIDGLVLDNGAYIDALFDIASGRESPYALGASRIIDALSRLESDVPRAFGPCARSWDGPRYSASRDSQRYKMAVEAKAEGRRVLIEIAYKDNSLCVRIEPRSRRASVSIWRIDSDIASAVYVIDNLAMHLETLCGPDDTSIPPDDTNGTEASGGENSGNRLKTQPESQAQAA